jgi:hypothetical protein
MQARVLIHPGLNEAAQMAHVIECHVSLVSVMREAGPILEEGQQVQQHHACGLAVR